MDARAALAVGAEAEVIVDAAAFVFAESAVEVALSLRETPKWRGGPV